jgi:hypothetical protein
MGYFRDMLLLVLLSGYIPPSSGFFYLLFVAVSLFVVVGLWLLVLGVRQLKQDSSRMRGYWLVIGALAVPVLGFCLLVNGL